jgi:uncharacterized protein (TIGR02453 family)
MEAVTDFLRELSINNNKDRFHAHQTQYKEARKVFKDFVIAMRTSITKFDRTIWSDLAPSSMIFRINRDARFSKNKAPYKTNFGALISME